METFWIEWWRSFIKIDAGQVVMILVVYRGLQLFGMEHEMLIDWYCESHKINKRSLLTRKRSILLALLGVGSRE